MGKGTQAERLEKNFGWVHVSTGDMLRDAMQEGTYLGQKVKKYVERGDLVPDDLMVEMVRDRLSKEDCKKGFILDGFPRTVIQAEKLDGIFDELELKLDGVISIEVSEEEIVRRLSERLICAGCGRVVTTGGNVEKDERCSVCGDQLVRRKDDKPETIRYRLKVYEKQTRPLILYYAGRKLLRKVDGVGLEDEIYCRILSALGFSPGKG